MMHETSKLLQKDFDTLKDSGKAKWEDTKEATHNAAESAKESTRDAVNKVIDFAETSAHTIKEDTLETVETFKTAGSNVKDFACKYGHAIKEDAIADVDAVKGSATNVENKIKSKIKETAKKVEESL